MQLDREAWAQVLQQLDTALGLPVEARGAWLAALPLAAPLKAALRQLLADRRAIETADFLGGGAERSLLQAERSLLQAERSLLQAGGQLGAWRLLRCLGQGGMATVWLAERADGAHQRQVALKLPHRVLGARVIAERFRRERAILSTLQHPHIAQVLDAGDAAGQPWLALEFVAGQAITSACAGQSLRARLALFAQLVLAVQHAHAQLVIHRDIKPSNVLVTADGQVKLLDFGVAKLLGDDATVADTALTEQGGRALTLQYASPEQIAGRPLGVASDVYALGVLLYQLLTGALPYTLKRDSAAALEEAILSAQVRRPSQAVADRAQARRLHGDLDTIVMKALAVQPAQRYASAAALGEDIERHLQALPIRARPASLAYRTGRWVRRHAWAAGAVAAVLATAGVGLTTTLWQAQRAASQARSAQATSDFLVGLFADNDAREQSPQAVAETTALQLIERGRQRLADGPRADLADAPEARARLLGTLADLYAGMAQPQRATELRAQSIAVWRQLPGQALQVATGQRQLSAWALAMDRDAEAERHAQEGLAALQGLQGEAVERERGNLHAMLGDVLWRRDPRLAEPAYRQAIALLGKQPVKEDEYPGALNGLAFILFGRGQTAEALALLQTMRDERVKRWGDGSMLVAAVDRDLAHFQSGAGQPAEALRTSQRVLSVMQAQAHPDSVEALTARFSHALILQELDRHAEALPLLQATGQRFASRGDGNFVYGALADAAAAHSLIELGRVAEALPLAERAARLMQQKAPAHGATPVAQASWALALGLSGQYAQAQAVYGPLHERLANESAFKSRGPAIAWLRHAEMALQQDLPEEALTLLARGDATIQPASPFYQPVREKLQALRARIALRQGLPRAAPATAAATLR